MEDTINFDGGLKSRETEATRHYVGNKVKPKIILFQGLPVSNRLYLPRINNVEKPGEILELWGNINHHEISSIYIKCAEKGIHVVSQNN